MTTEFFCPRNTRKDTKMEMAEETEGGLRITRGSVGVRGRGGWSGGEDWGVERFAEGRSVAWVGEFGGKGRKVGVGWEGEGGGGEVEERRRGEQGRQGGVSGWSEGVGVAKVVWW